MIDCKLPLLIFVFCALPVQMAQAQTGLQTQSIEQKDDCPGADVASSCASDAMWSNNGPKFLKWAQIAAAQGEYLPAYWLGGTYGSGSEKSNIKRDLVRAYMWYDIAAFLQAREIQKLPPASNPGDRKTNQQAINYRDGVGRKMTAAEIDEALRLEKEWLSRHGQR